MSQKDVLVRVVGKHFFQSVPLPVDSDGGIPDLVRHEIGARITVPADVQQAQPFRLVLVEESVPASAPADVQTSPPPVSDVEEVVVEVEKVATEVIQKTPVESISDVIDEPLTIKALPLPPNQLSVLWQSGFKTIESLSAVSDEDLLKIKGIGKSSLKKIRAACSAIE